MSLKFRKGFAIFTGVVLLWQFIVLVATRQEDERLFNYIFTLLAAALFGYALLRLKMAWDKEEKEKDEDDNRQ